LFEQQKRKCREVQGFPASCWMEKAASTQRSPAKSKRKHRPPEDKCRQSIQVAVFKIASERCREPTHFVAGLQQ
jgi:curli biogenesis system outer membrane secretion channel CsgG